MWSSTNFENKLIEFCELAAAVRGIRQASSCGNCFLEEASKITNNNYNTVYSFLLLVLSGAKKYDEVLH
jgi:hypothetical protein